MVLSFENSPQIHQRYTLLSAPAASNQILGEPSSVKGEVKGQGNPSSETTGEQYASFLRSLTNPSKAPERKPIKSSPRAPKTSPRGLTRARFQPVGRAFLEGDRDGYSASPRSPVKPESPTPGSLAAVLRLKVKNDEEHEKRMKVIEDHMWQHKQKERELKRAEGDVIKKQRHLKKTMQEYETAIYKKQRQEELMVNESAKDVEKARQQYSIQDERLTRSRAERNIADLQNVKEKERKGIVLTNSTEFQYERVAEAIKRKRQEVENLSKEFEAKLKMKEEEEFKLKKQLADLAITVNMEAQKQRVQKIDVDRLKQQTTVRDIQEKLKREEEFNDKMKNSTEKGMSSERNKRRLSQELNSTLSHVTLQIREEGRKMTDIKTKLQDNSLHQRNTHMAANYNAKSREKMESQERIKMVEARRAHIQDLITKERQQRSAQCLDEWKTRYLEKNNEYKRRTLEDNISHLQRVVGKQEDLEHALYNQVRSSEALRRKQETNVQKIRMELESTKKENQRILKETAIECQTREKELEQKLLKEEASLKKYLTEREEKIQTFVIHRSRSEENRHMLKEEQKVHDRLFRIGQKTDKIEQEMYA